MTKEEAKEYIDNYLSHIIAMVEYGNWFALEVKGMVEECKDELDKLLRGHNHCNTKKVCKEIEKEITARLEELAADVTDFILEQTDDVINIETDWLEENIASPLDVEFKYPDKSKSLLLAIPVATAGVVGEYGKTISDRLYNIYHQKVMQSYVSGSSFNDLEEEYVSRFNTFDRGLQADSETLGESLSSQYDRIIYTANDNKIKGYMWIATLDTNTCLLCSSLDHTTYQKIEDVPIYAKHNHCRCSVCILTEDIEDVVPETYSEWFEQQSDKDKYKILGKTRFQLYEQGMKIKNFVNNGKITPLKDLKK